MYLTILGPSCKNSLFSNPHRNHIKCSNPNTSLRREAIFELVKKVEWMALRLKLGQCQKHPNTPPYAPIAPRVTTYVKGSNMHNITHSMSTRHTKANKWVPFTIHHHFLILPNKESLIYSTLRPHPFCLTALNMENMMSITSKSMIIEERNYHFSDSATFVGPQ